MADVARVTVVLDVLAETRRPMSVTAVTDRTGLPRSTVHRVLQSLEKQLYVVRSLDPEQPGYVLGPALLKFGTSAHLRLLAANRAALIGLTREVNENVELAVFSGREVVVVDQLASPARMRGVTQVGRSFSLHASSIGKALLSMLPDARVGELLAERLPAFTERTVTDRGELLAELAEVRESGVAIDVEEHDAGICAVATATTGPTGALQAVAVVVPTRRFVAKAPALFDGLARLNPAVRPEVATSQLGRRP